MPSDRSELAARLAECRPSDTLRGMFFSSLLSVLRRDLGEAAATEVEALFPKGRRVDFLSYPLTHWLPGLYRAVDLVEPKLGIAGAFRLLGRQAVDDFYASPAGRTVLVVATGHPTTLMKTSPTAYRMAITWGERRVEFPGKYHCVYHFERELVPMVFHEGVVHSSVVAVGGKSVEVTSVQETLTGGRIDIRWAE
jgi:uncharacterized protein (TIGR02265 family)